MVKLRRKRHGVFQREIKPFRMKSAQKIVELEKMFK